MSVPKVLFVGPSVKAMLLEPILLGLLKVADVRVTYVPATASESMMTAAFRRSRGIWVPNFAKVAAKKLLSTTAPPLEIGGLPFEPDLVFVAEVYRKVKGLERLKCPRAYYAMDPHISTSRYLELAVVDQYDCLFVRQKDMIRDFWEAGCRNTAWLPECFNIDNASMGDEPRYIPISFFGHADSPPERKAMVEMLEKRFTLIHPPAYGHELVSYLHHSKIAFNHTRAGDLNNRVFDAMASGAMLMTERIGNGLFDLFKEGVHLCSYSDIRELEEKVSYYLDHGTEREWIADNGKEAAWRAHTNIHRAKQILDVCLGTKDEMNPAISKKIPA